MTTTISSAKRRNSGACARLGALLLALSLLLCLSACGQTDPLCGSYLCRGAEADGLSVDSSLLGEESARLVLSSDGRGTLTRAGTQGGLSWTREGEILRLEIGGTVYDASIRDGEILLPLEPGLALRFVREDGAPQETPGPGPWEWYGWWSVENSQGLMPDSWRDCCARLENSPFGPVLTLWDEDSSFDLPFAVLHLRWENGLAVTESGWLLQAQIDGLDWTVDPEASLWKLEGAYQDGESSFTFQIRLRPWGQLWPEEGRIPFRYTDWYLPLIRDGASMPDQIGSHSPSGGRA